MASKPCDPDLALLRSFVAVVEAGGFTAAADRVHRTQSTVSQQIRRLEESLGCTLLERASNGTTLTTAGEQVLLYARRMLALSNELGDRVADHRQRPVLRLGITDDYAQIYLSALLHRFKQTCPQVKLNVVCDLSIRLQEGLARGDYDLAIYKRTTPQGNGERMHCEPMQWIAAKDYQAEPGEALPLILFQSGCVYRQRALARLDEAGRRWRVCFESPSTVSVQAATQAGLGIAVFTPSSLPEGCVEIDLGLPALGTAELVYELGKQPPVEVECLLKDILALVGESLYQPVTTSDSALPK